MLDRATTVIDSVDCQVVEATWQDIFLTLVLRVTESPSEQEPARQPLTSAINSEARLSASSLFPDVPFDTSDNSYAFVLVDADRALTLPVEKVTDHEYRATINVTNFENRRQIPNGSWQIVPIKDDVVYPAAGFDLKRLHKLDEWSRSFIYNGNKSSFTFNFDISEHDTRPEFIMRAYQFGRSPKGSGAKANLPTRILKYPRKKVWNKRNISRVQNLYYKLWRRFSPKRGNHIVFASEARGSLAGNLLAVRDRMVERGLDKQFKISYSFSLPDSRTKRIRLKQLRTLAAADFIIVDDYFPILSRMKFDPKTVIIQAWHAGSGFKAIGYSRFGKYGSPTLANAHRHYTYAITGSKHLVPVYAEAFGIEESAIIPTGLPRIDKFLDADATAATTDKFAKDYPQLQGKRTILFAPTFRGRGMTTAYYDYSQIDFDALYEMCGEDTVILFRMHHFVQQPVPIRPEHADRFFDFSHYPDGLGLLHCSDVLVTDYSSIIYEYALLNRPMAFFAYDKDIYAATRGFHRDFDETAPGTVCETFDCLLETLKTESYDLDKIVKFREENFDRIDTHSSDRFIDWLILGQRPEEDQ